MARHVHADVIHAYAEGETIQYRANGEWVDFCEVSRSPNFFTEGLYRVKPKMERTFIRLTDEEIREILGPFAGDPISGYTRKLFDEIQDKLEKVNGH